MLLYNNKNILIILINKKIFNLNKANYLYLKNALDMKYINQRKIFKNTLKKYLIIKKN